MPTVLRENGFEVKMCFNDHPPPHIHAFKGGGETKINLDPVEVMRVWNMPKPETQKAKRLVRKHREYLLKTWEEMHDE
jgi:hypothetical protein